MKLRTAFLLTLLVLATSACGPRGSGFAPADNAVTASPSDDIDLQPDDYELPGGEEASEGISSTSATGDSSGGASHKMSTVDVDALPMGSADSHGEEASHSEKGEHAAEDKEHSEEEGEATADVDSGDRAETSSGGGSASETAKELEAVQSRSAELNQELRELDKQAETLKRDLLMTQIDAASGLSNIRGTYVVQEGDTVEAIANSFYGNAEGGNAILEANRDLLDADGKIFPGLVLIIPNPDGSGSGAATGASAMTSETEAETTESSEANSEASEDNQEASASEESSEDASEENEDAEAPEESESEEGSADAEAESSEAVAASFDWQELGEKTYMANCVACHQANGQGIPGAFPPLANHIPKLYNAEGGRDYIIQTVLYGLMGEVEIEGTSYNGVMNPWGQLSDEQIAATLNHELTSWGNDGMIDNFSPIMPAEVAALRDQNLSGSDVLELRPELP